MTNTTTTFNGKFKEKYAARLESTLPDAVPFQEDVPFSPNKDRIGKKYVQPVLLSFEHGVTYSAADQGAFALNAAVAAVHKPAEVVGAQIALSSAIDIETISRGLDQDRRVGDDPLADVLKNMKNAIGKHVEMTHLWGGETKTTVGWGRIASSGSGTTSQTVVIKLSDWAPAIWAGCVGMPIAIYDSDGTAGAPSTALAGVSNACTITAINLSTRTLTISGDQTELDNVETQSNNGSDPYIYPKGAKGAQWQGLVEVAGSTSGTIFGIDGSVYEQFTGNSYPVGSPLSFNKIISALDGAVGRGLDEDVTFYINHKAWTDVASDQAALRSYDASYNASEFKNGAKALKFMHQSGEVTIKTHKFMKEGYAVAWTKPAVKRLGAVDITFKVPNTEEDFLYHLPSNMGIGLRAYTMQAFFSPTPSRLTLLTGIVNST